MFTWLLLCFHTSTHYSTPTLFSTTVFFVFSLSITFWFSFELCHVLSEPQFFSCYFSILSMFRSLTLFWTPTSELLISSSFYNLHFQSTFLWFTMKVHAYFSEKVRRKLTEVKKQFNAESERFKSENAENRKEKQKKWMCSLLPRFLSALFEEVFYPATWLFFSLFSLFPSSLKNVQKSLWIWKHPRRDNKKARHQEEQRDEIHSSVNIEKNRNTPEFLK